MVLFGNVFSDDGFRMSRAQAFDPQFGLLDKMSRSFCPTTEDSHSEGVLFNERQEPTGSAAALVISPPLEPSTHVRSPCSDISSPRLAVLPCVDQLQASSGF
jgi:hypothetical protein